MQDLFQNSTKRTIWKEYIYRANKIYTDSKVLNSVFDEITPNFGVKSNFLG